MSDYHTLVSKLFSINQNKKVKMGLDSPLALHRALGSPAEYFKSVHVAGTNGKGSVCIKIAEALQEQGYRVGLFTSPHIATFRERIRVNGVMITENEVEEALKAMFALETEATFFEMTTMMAFKHFKDNEVDFAVIETGLGGRLDATNVVDPVLSIITSIGFDHMEYLGNTLEAIAYEKAGIIKKGKPVVIGPSVPFETIETVAADCGSPLHVVDGSYASSEEENCAIARLALELLGIGEEAIVNGLEARLPCRFEVVSSKGGGIPIIMDVAHNGPAMEWLFKEMQRRYNEKPIVALVGMSKEKDHKASLKCLSEHVATIHLAKADNGRGAEVSELKGCLDEAQPRCGVCCHGSVTDGVNAAIREAEKVGGVVLICGTFFIMAEARRTVGMDDPTDFVDMNEKF